MITERNSNIIRIWLLIVTGLIMVMVVFGGLVRLTRSGLSIVEWDLISGIIPPIGEAAWQAEFSQYQQTPEFKLVNNLMTLPEYKKIYYLEYVHRLIARLAGLVVALPLLYFLLTGMIPWRNSGLYTAIGLLFGLQGYLGWFMVSSGLVDRPAVSHFRLTLHLLTALLLLGMTFWLTLRHTNRFRKPVNGALRSLPGLLALLLSAVLVLQIAYGGLMAGLKAGYVSNSYPLMAGRLIPPDLLRLLEPWWLNLVSNPLTVHFIHRWFALVVLIVSLAIYFVMRQRGGSAAVSRGVALMVGLTAAQVALGVSVIWFYVPLALALSHQALALFLYSTTIYIVYQVSHEPVPLPVVERTRPAYPAGGVPER